MCQVTMTQTVVPTQLKMMMMITMGCLTLTTQERFLMYVQKPLLMSPMLMKMVVLQLKETQMAMESMILMINARELHQD